MLELSVNASGGNLVNAVHTIYTSLLESPTTAQVIELATVLGEAVRRNNSKSKIVFYDELRLLADECNKSPDREAIGLAIYAFIAAREGGNKAR